MSPSPINPLPSAAVNSTASGGTWVSGNNNSQTSGTPVDYIEYYQTLEVEYVRNPKYASDNNPPTKGLDLLVASSTYQTDVYCTELQLKVTATARARRISGAYVASSFYQPQKFALYAQAEDKYGVSAYGSLSSFNFGPQGKIVTTQPYIRRVPWSSVSGTAKEYHEGVEGYSHALRMNPAPSAIVGNPSYSQMWWNEGCPLAEPFEHFISNSNIRINLGGKFQGDRVYPWALRQSAAPSMTQYGIYQVSAEPGSGVNRLANFLDDVARSLTHNYWTQRLVSPVVYHSNNLLSERIVEDDKVTQMEYYDQSQHDFS